MRPKIHIGTSGFSYDHWQGILYPHGSSSKERFRHYRSVFNTVEINNTFYHLPDKSVFKRWKEWGEDMFCFTIKANRYLTHVKRLKEIQSSLNKFYECVLELKETAGPVLFQLPPRWNVNIERLSSFIHMLPENHRAVLEFRDSRWHCGEIFDLLKRNGVSFCIHDYPGVTSHALITGPFAYLRFHGPYPGYGGSYSYEHLKYWAVKISEWEKAGFPVYVYFNNDGGGFAVENAKTLIQIMAIS
ncbi:MAG: DUF72 domain-containing protein [Candidatus Aureabacteria bacterium]|nr:DUF72 domain-containing protein [Candidatus Auribacterota bacterium]